MFIKVPEALMTGTPGEVAIRLMLDFDRAVIYKVDWAPDTAPQECDHAGAHELAIVLEGAIIDEDGTVHGKHSMWMRPPGDVHYPKAGPEGASLVLFRLPTPAEQDAHPTTQSMD